MREERTGDGTFWLIVVFVATVSLACSLFPGWCRTITAASHPLRCLRLLSPVMHLSNYPLRKCVRTVPFQLSNNIHPLYSCRHHSDPVELRQMCRVIHCVYFCCIRLFCCCLYSFMSMSFSVRREFYLCCLLKYS